VTVFEEMNLPPGDSITTGDGVIQFTSPISQTQVLTITYTPTLTSSHISSDFQFAGVFFQLQATGPGGEPVIDVSPPLTITVHYDESTPPSGTDENSLNLYRYDEPGEMWILVPVISRNPAANTITISLDHFSEFALMTPSEKEIFVPLIVR